MTEQDAIQTCVKVAIEDAELQIQFNHMKSLTDDCPDDCENFYTLSNLYSDHPDIEDKENASTIIFNALVENFPEFS
jgi:hypothetical protein